MNLQSFNAVWSGLPLANAVTMPNTLATPKPMPVPALESSSLSGGAGAALRFAGYAALFDRPDAGRDVIRRGAFRRSLAVLHVSGDVLPLLWQHRPDQRIGWVEHIAEDERGLRVIGRLDGTGALAARQLHDGRLTGLSFGFRTVDSRIVTLPDRRNGRELIDVEIFEVSLVGRPMQHGARVHLIS